MTRVLAAALANCIAFTCATGAVAQGLSHESTAGAVDSEHLFGFTTGSDIGDAGELELEKETNAAIGRRYGRYVASATTFQAKYTAVDNFRIAPYFAATYHAISASPPLSDINRLALAAGGVELKYRALDRAKAPFGLTFGGDLSQGVIDRDTGQSARVTALDLNAAIDRELVPARVFGALNLSYSPSWTYEPVGQLWERSAKVASGAAIAHQIVDKVFVGAELRYMRAYEGTGLGHFAGEALFAGPTLYVVLPANGSMTIAWNSQIAGHARGDARALDLAHFERHQLRVRFGFGL